MNHARTGLVLLSLALASGCGDDGDDSSQSAGGGAGAPSSGGSNASGGSSGSGGSQSAGGSSGSAGAGGAGSGGTAGSAGSAQGGSSGSGGQGSTLSFFATSKGSGDLGGNLGGLEGADAICQSLAEAVGAGDREWRAYLSTSAEDAADRIGDGPWYNVNGDLIAADVASLHGDGLMRDPVQLVLDENGDPVPSDEHDILTGSTEDGTYLADATCADWTSDSADDDAQVGHSDIPPSQFSPSWNAAHTTNCSPEGLEATGGAGRLYCFAAD